MVAELCRDRDLFLVSDEVYREFVYDGRQAVSALSLPGFEDTWWWWTACPSGTAPAASAWARLATRNRDVYAACLKMAQGRLSAPGLAQVVALGGPRAGPGIHAGVVAEYQKRRDILFEGLSRHPGRVPAQAGGGLLLRGPPARPGQRGLRELAALGLPAGRRTVMVAPAPGFYATPGLGADEVRIAYVLKEADLRAAVGLLGEALEEYGRAPGRTVRVAAVEVVPDDHVPAE